MTQKERREGKREEREERRQGRRKKKEGRKERRCRVGRKRQGRGALELVSKILLIIVLHKTLPH